MKVQVRRYNFIVGTNLLYSGLFHKSGWIDLGLLWDLKSKREVLSKKYRVPVKAISISNTIKG